MQVGKSNSSTREEWLTNILSSIPIGKRILDAGAGELANKKYCQHLDYISQDLCQYEGCGDTKGLQMGEWDTSKIDIICDIVSIPEPDNSFDVILCSEVFEHLPNPVFALQEFHRLLKPEGKLILTAPFCSLTHFAPYHYSSGFNKYFYEYHLHEQGFSIQHIEANGNFFEYIAQELLRTPSIAQKYAVSNVSRIERYAIKVLLKMLTRLSRKNNNSEELLCFGYHVIAEKVK